MDERRYSSQTDFVVHGNTYSPFPAFEAGQVYIAGSLTKGITSDDIAIVICIPLLHSVILFLNLLFYYILFYFAYFIYFFDLKRFEWG